MQIIISFFKIVNLKYQEIKTLWKCYNLDFQDLCSLEVIYLSTPVERIFCLLKEAGIEQKEFAQLLGTTDKTVSAWKTGRSQSYTKYLSKISEVLGTTAEYLLTGKKEEPTVQDDGLTDGERALMKQFRQLTPEQQDMVLRMVQAAADNQ